MKCQDVNSKELTQFLDKIYRYNTTNGEFLLPIMDAKKNCLKSLKKLFNGSDFLLKSIGIEKVKDKCYLLVIKGKKQIY